MMKKKTRRTELPQFIKIVYFDDDAAQYYLDISNGGHEEREDERQEQTAKGGSAKVEAHAKAGINLLELVKGVIDGKASAEIDTEVTRVVRTILASTLLTEFLSACNDDDEIVKIQGDGVYAPEGSASMYKMISAYLTIVPQSELPVDMEKLNQAVLDERGYYGLLLKNEKNIPKRLLRFNVHAFKNQYNFVDLAKMELTFYGVKVGNCNIDELSINNEFMLAAPHTESEPDLNDVFKDEEASDDELGELEVLDVILAGVVRG